MFEGLKRSLKYIAKKISTTRLSEKDIENISEEMILNLVQNDVAFEAAEYIINQLKEKLSEIEFKRFSDKEKIVESILKDIILNLIYDAGKLDIIKFVKDIRNRNKPCIILFVGPNGHGKTTTLIKVAYYFMKNNFSVTVSASDTFRAGAIEQLEYYCKELDIPLISLGYGSDPTAVAYDTVNFARKNKIDIVLIDTAGRMQTKVNLMNEMKKISRVIEPDLKIFVGDILTGNDMLNQAIEFNNTVSIDGSILTKADADVKGGSIISVIYATKKPVMFLGIGQRYEDLIEFTPEWLLKKLGFNNTFSH